MKFNVKQVIDAPLPLVLAVVKDRTRDVEVYPNVTELTVNAWEEDENGIRVDIVTRGDGEIPRPLRKLLTRKMISWKEIGYYDKRKGHYDYEIKTFYFSDVFKMKGRFSFSQNGNGKTLRELNAEVKISVPLLGAIAEAAIAHNIKHNLELEYKQMDRYFGMEKYREEAEALSKLLEN